MTRWHKSSCKAPHIVVDEMIPRCMACNRSPPLQAFISKSSSINPFPPIPPDEPPEQLNLWWPPCVPYSKSSPGQSAKSGRQAESPGVYGQSTKASSHHSERDSKEGAPEGIGSSVLEATTLGLQNSEIYGNTLGVDEFRLLCLSPAVDSGYHVHATLETYRHDCCPEYETVSYTWGAEEGDSTLCCPAYIGPYWDVLLQTRNCWAMLHYMRPWRGIRIVWVDAICISQNNVIERQDQVAKMGRIYEESLRVFVYLGEDIVCPRPNNPKHLARHQLHTLGGQLTEPRFHNNFQTQAQIDLEFILKRRYFSRVWVIQGLILSRQALIPVGDVEFMADCLTSKNLESRILRYAWDETGAPWFKHVGRRRLPATNILEAMRLTSKCDSTDPRDKIFGILGILGEDKILSAVRPDYSLSYQHVYIGIFSFLLLNLRNPQLLRKAAGIFASPSYPSWWPDRFSAGVFAEEPDFVSQDVIRATVFRKK
jgi:hypothetical protein